MRRIASRPIKVGPVDEHLAVEAPGPEQGRVEDVGAIGGRENYETARGVEAVHFDEELIQGLFALVVAAHGALKARLADGVELVYEHDARGFFARLLEEVAGARGADADEHLDELCAAHTEEGDARLARDRAREEGLAGARGADEEHALGYLAADLRVFPRVLEEIDHFDELFLGLVDARDVVETRLDVALGHDHRLVLAECQNVVVDIAQPPEHDAPNEVHEGEGENPIEDEGDECVAPLARGRRVDYPFLVEEGGKARIVDGDRLEGGRRVLQGIHYARRRGCLGLEIADVVVLGHLDALDLSARDLRLELAVGDDAIVRLAHEIIEENDREDHDEDVAERKTELKATEARWNHGRFVSPRAARRGFFAVPAVLLARHVHSVRGSWNPPH